MSDLIRRDEALAGILNHYEVNNEIQNKEMDYCFDMLNSLRAVDAVEVVRCYECKHWEPMNKGSWMDINRTDGACRALMEFRLAERYMTEKDHFCGFGERREEDEVD